MPLGRTYKEIERMVRQKVLTTQMARKIVRKAGFRPGTISSGGGVRTSAIPILTIGGARLANGGPGEPPGTPPGTPVPNAPWPGTRVACSLELQELIEAFKGEQSA